MKFPIKKQRARDLCFPFGPLVERLKTAVSKTAEHGFESRPGLQNIKTVTAIFMDETFNFKTKNCLEEFNYIK